MSVTPYEFVDEVPEPRYRLAAKTKYEVVADACKANPGRWLVAQRRPADKTANVRTMGAYLRKNYGLTCKSRLQGDECVLYASWQNGTTT